MLKYLSIMFLWIFPLIAEVDTTPTPPSYMEQATESPAPISYEGAFIKMLLTLGGLLVLIFLSVWMLRRVSQGRLGSFGQGGGQNIKILEKRPLSAKSVLYLVEVRGKKVLIAESQLEVRGIPLVEELTE